MTEFSFLGGFSITNNLVLAAILFHYIRKKADIFPIGVSKNFTPKQSRWINSSTGESRNTTLSLYCSQNSNSSNFFPQWSSKYFPFVQNDKSASTKPNTPDSEEHILSKLQHIVLPVFSKTKTTRQFEGLLTGINASISSWKTSDWGKTWTQGKEDVSANQIYASLWSPHVVTCPTFPFFLLLFTVMNERFASGQRPLRWTRWTHEVFDKNNRFAPKTSINNKHAKAWLEVDVNIYKWYSHQLSLICFSE